MSFSLTLLSLSPARLEQCLKARTLWLPGYEEQDLRKDPARTDILQTWEGLYWLLTYKRPGDATPLEIPWRWCMLSDQLLAAPAEIWLWDYFYVLPEQVAQVAAALDAISETELMQRLQSNWRRWRTFFPQLYKDKQALRRILWEEFEHLRKCYREAAAQGNALVTTFTYKSDPAYFMYYKNQLIGEIFHDGGDFPWYHGYIEPTLAMQPLLKFAAWENSFIDVEGYYPWNDEYEESEEYPKNNRKRFLMSDNYKAILQINELLEVVQSLGKKEMTITEMEAIPALADFASTWRFAFRETGEDRVNVRDLHGFRSYLHPRNWRVVDADGKVNPAFRNPPPFDPERMTLGWR